MADLNCGLPGDSALELLLSALIDAVSFEPGMTGYFLGTDS